MFYLTFVHPCSSTHTHTRTQYLPHTLPTSLTSALPFYPAPSLPLSLSRLHSVREQLRPAVYVAFGCCAPVTKHQMPASKHTMREKESQKESVKQESASARERESKCSQDSCRCVCLCICLLHIFAIAGVCRQRRQRCVAVVLRFSAHLDVATTT